MTASDSAPELRPAPGPQELTVHEVRALLERDPGLMLYDVRTPAEFQIARLDRGVLLDEPTAQGLLERADRDVPLVFLCHHGVRSLNAAAYFAERGFTRVYSVAGGIHAWSTEIDPSVPTY